MRACGGVEDHVVAVRLGGRLVGRYREDRCLRGGCTSRVSRNS